MGTTSKIRSVLIIGMAGGLARITAELISRRFPEIEITGVDSRPLPPAPPGERLKVINMRYTRGNFEKLFRDQQFDLVIHLARMSHAKDNSESAIAQRLDLNVMGTNMILDLSLKFCAKKIIVLSTYHVYGALADNPVFLSEESSLRASIKYPELRDVVEMDQMSSGWMWKNQHNIETVILRPCTIVGPQIKNTMTRYLSTSHVPICADFNPMFQFMHEFDMAQAILAAIDALPTGIYNIAPDEVISIKEAKKAVGTATIPVPSFALQGLAKITSSAVWSFPRYLIDYIKFASIIDNTSFKAHAPGFEFRFKTREALELLRLD
jgi:UDP-glucose 4-epimerase